LSTNDVKTACQTACPTEALIFGDINDKKSDVYKKINAPLTYVALEEINTQSSVRYGAKIINRDDSLMA
ncbi:MAG: hypothetical protein AB8G15_22935, partial [Saprospiraceae bacterium]